ncbi:MAG: hypothetical protein KC996_03565 [Phycisphaerales bacterium]|nr:hypothetical protein [Phycisphaerales bacterium]
MRESSPPPGETELDLAGEIELGILIDLISERLGINIVSSSVAETKKIRIRSPRSVPDEALMSLLELSLRTHELILAPGTDEHWFTILESKDLLAAAGGVEKQTPARPQLPNARKPFREQQAERVLPATVELRIVRPEHISLARAEEVMKPFLTKQASTLLELPEDGALVIADYADRVERAAEILKLADQPARRAAVRFLPVNYALASDLADQARQVLTAQAKVGGTKGEVPVEILVDDRTGQLILVGSDAAMEDAVAVIESLDMGVPIDRQPVQFYRLENTKAEEVLATILLLEEGDGIVGLDMQAVEELIETPDAESELFRAADDPRSAAVGGPRVAVDVPSNTLIVVGNPREQAIYGRLIEQLDVRRPQVMIEITVVVLDTSDSYRLGIDIGGNFGGNPNTVTFSSFGLSDVDPDTGNLTLKPGLGFNGAILSPDFADIVIQALQTDSHARVMSAPRLLVNDNASGVLRNTAQEPFESFNSFDTGSSSSTFGGFVDAGTLFEVTPRISNGDHLTVEYKIELSSFGDRSISDLPPPRNQNTLESVVTLPDGHTIITGGIRTSTETQSTDSVPLLGDLPLLGQLFRNDRESGGESTIFVFIRPTILRNNGFDDLRLLSEQDVTDAGLDPDFPQSEPMLMGGQGEH